jgi:large subunit ribosomal protein L16
MLEPKKVKHKKWHKGRSTGVETRGTNLDFGSFGLKSMGYCWIKSCHIEAARLAINRALKRKGRFWIRIFPDKPVTSKPAEVGMGGGKGNVSHYVFPIKPGRIMFEIDGVKEDVAKEAFRKASDKLPVKTKFIKH